VTGPPVELAETDRPRLRRGVRLAFDDVRESHVLLYPEGVLLLNETAGAVLARCDGATDLAAILAALGAVYRDVPQCEVSALLRTLAARRLIELEPAEVSSA
jgi:pyrroloquinoline quinone biosynthesis protein D